MASITAPLKSAAVLLLAVWYHQKISANSVQIIDLTYTEGDESSLVLLEDCRPDIFPILQTYHPGVQAYIENQSEYTFRSHH